MFCDHFSQKGEEYSRVGGEKIGKISEKRKEKKA
jgi:hypothetical protein